MARSTGWLADLAGVAPGDHICMTFGSDAEHRALITRYITDGLTGGDRVLYFGEAYDEPVVRSYLLEAGVAADEEIARGALAFIPARAAYLPEGRFDPDGMLRTFREQTESALQDGYRSLRAAGEMSWVLPDVLDEWALVDYEFRADLATAGSQQVGLCRYDRRRTPAHTLSSVAAVHGAWTGAPDIAAGLAVYASGEGAVLVDGEVDLATVEFFESMMGSVSAAVPNPILDLSKLTFIDVRGLRAIAEMAADLAHGGRRLTLEAIPAVVRRSLALLGAEELASGDGARRA